MKTQYRNAVLAAGALVTAGVAAQPAQSKTNMLFCNFLPPRHVISTGIVVPWLKGIEKATEGRVKIRIVSACRMAPPPLQMVMVQKGTADGAFVFDAFLRKLVPSTQIALHPQMATTAVGRAVAQWRMQQKFFAGKNNYKGLQVAGWFGGSDSYWYSMTDKPMNSMAILKSIKTWTLPSVPARALELSGANIVPGPAVRIYPIVSKGVVDAFVGISYADLNAFKVRKYAKSATELPGGWFGATFSTFFNKKKWDTIPAKDQKIIMSLSGEKLATRSFAWDQQNVKARKNFAKKSKIYTMPAAEMAKLRKAWAPMYETWKKSVSAMGVDGKAALEFFRAQAAEVDAATKKKLGN